jgi:hypothetical protein
MRRASNRLVHGNGLRRGVREGSPRSGLLGAQCFRVASGPAGAAGPRGDGGALRAHAALVLGRQFWQVCL